MRLQLYILRRLTSSLVLVLLVVSSILFIGQTVRFLARTPDVGLDFVLEVLPMLLPVTLSLTLPLTFLVAVVLTYGRLSDDNEVLAARMAGIHPWVLVAPGVFAGALLTWAGLHLHGTIAPNALARQNSMRKDIYRRFTEIIERGARSSFTNRDFKISWASVEDGELVDIHISKGGLYSEDYQEIHARRGVLKKDAEGQTLVFSLRDLVQVHGGKEQWNALRSEDFTFAVSAPDLLDVRTGTPKARTLAYDELLFRMLRWPKKTGVHRLMAREVFGRLALSLSPLIFALCGIPLALLVGKGSRAAAAVLAFGVALVFYLFWQAGSTLAGNGDLPPAVAMLSGDTVLLVVGVLLLRKVVRR
ncbi:MAG: LptF/LptG family permease [Planctomycetota bacterium]